MILLTVILFKVLDRAKSQLFDKTLFTMKFIHVVATETLVINTSLMERASNAIEKASEMKSATVDDAVSWQSVLAELTQSKWP